MNVLKRCEGGPCVEPSKASEESRYRIDNFDPVNDVPRFPVERRNIEKCLRDDIFLSTNLQNLQNQIRRIHFPNCSNYCQKARIRCSEVADQSLYRRKMVSDRFDMFAMEDSMVKERYCCSLEEKKVLSHVLRTCRCSSVVVGAKATEARTLLLLLLLLLLLIVLLTEERHLDWS